MKLGTRSIARSFTVGIILLTQASLFGCGIGAPSYRALYAEREPEILIHRFRADAAAGEYSGNMDFGRLFAEYLAGTLQERGVHALVVEGSSADLPNARYVIEGEITRLDPGSWGLRFWIGLGAGRARFGSRVWVSRVTDKRRVFDETLEDRSATWQGQEDILRRCAASLARSFAARIVRDIRATERERTEGHQEHSLNSGAQGVR